MEIVRLCNICFFQGAEQLDHNHPKLEYVVYVSVTFKRQKKNKKMKMDTITQMASRDEILCPVRAAAAIVKKIKIYSGTSKNSPVSTVSNNKIIKQVTSDHVINALQDAVGANGDAKIGFKNKIIGTLSIRSSAVMVMYLGKSVRSS
jgi:hypothetical protein